MDRDSRKVFEEAVIHIDFETAAQQHHIPIFRM
jgi:hypothetical protein